LVAASVVLLAMFPAGNLGAAEPPQGPAPQPPPQGTAPQAEAINVLVVGAVRKPGKLALPAGSRLADALDASGLRTSTGPCMADQGDLHRVFLSRASEGRKTSYMIDLAQAPADPRYNPLLRENDIVYVPECQAGLPHKIIAIPQF
jgi:protein involved in polysaccharide export with SLBB domain